MKIYSTEDEQLGEIRQFFKEYGKVVGLSLILSIAAVGGWKYWKSHHQTSHIAASTAYERLINDIGAQDNSNALAEAANFAENNKTVYAVFTAMALSKHYVETGDFAKAQQFIELGLKNTDDSELTATLNIRLARILAQQGQYDQALVLLDKVKLQSWSAMVNNVRGDIYYTRQQFTEAYNAYNAALNSVPLDSQLKELIKMKLNQAEYLNAKQALETKKTDTQ